MCANGGNGDTNNGGGGGGGRITVTTGKDTFTGTVSAYGGAGYQSSSCGAGGAGTVYTVLIGQTPMVTIDNNMLWYGLTPLNPQLLPVTADITVQNDGILLPAEGDAHQQPLGERQRQHLYLWTLDVTGVWRATGLPE